MKTKNWIALALILCSSFLQAQNIKEATWIASIEQEVRKIHRSQLNLPLIETKTNNLFALEPNTGDILWKYAMKGLVESITPIDGTPFSLLNQNVLLDVSTGRAIDLSLLIKGQIASYHLIPESYDLVFYSKGPDYFLVIDLFNFAVRWNMKSDFSDKPGQTTKSKFGGAFAQLAETNNQSVMLGMECPPISNKAGGLIVAGFGKVTNVDNNGKVIWQVDQPKKKKGGLVKTVDNQTDLMIDATRDQFYILKSKMMTAMKISDGSVQWPEFYEVKGNRIMEAGLGLIPMSVYKEEGTGQGMFSKSKLNLVDPSTGKAVWPAELELNGFVDQYRTLENGNVAIVTYNQTNSKFQIIDVAKGKFIYPEEVKLKGRVSDFMIGKDKVLFATSKGVDVIDLATGNDLLSKMQKFDNDADIFTVYKGQMVYNIDAKNRKVYRTDLLANASVELIHDFKFQAGEKLVKYDVLPNGNVFLGSDHHMLVFTPGGQLVIDKPFDYEGREMDRFNNTMDKMNQVANTVNMVTSLAASAYVLGIGTATGTGPEALAASNSMVAPELMIHNLAKNERAAKYYLGLKRLTPDISSPGSFFARRNKEAKASYLSFVSKTNAEILFDIPLALDAKDPEFSIDESTGFLYYSPQFVDKKNSDYDAMFNPEKLKKAQANNELGFVAGYKF